MYKINEDELVGYIMRKTRDRALCYEDVRAVLDTELEFMEEKGLVEGEKEPNINYTGTIKVNK